jgi:HlyD family secretion protein
VRYTNEVKHLHSLLSAFSLKTAAYAAVALALLGGGWYFFAGGSGNAAQTIVVAPQDFTQQVSVSGKVVAAQDVDLGFSQGGRIAHVYVAVGDRVAAGALLAEIENGDLRAAVAEQQAKLSSLKAGAQPEDIAASQAALSKAQQDLDNLYQSISDTGMSAYTSAGDAVRTQLASLFSGGETATPQLTFSTANSQAAIDAGNARLKASGALNAWQSELAALPQSPSRAQLTALLNDSLSYLGAVRALLGNVSAALDGSNLSGSALAADKAAVVAAQTEVNAATKSLNTVSQSIASQTSTVSQAQAQLDLKRAGATAQDIAAQQALVEQAQAQLQKTLITAPFDGVITTVNAKVGLAAAANTPQISIESTGAFQIEAYVPEVNIAQVAVGNTATVTLDAFGPQVSFGASVVSIDPAETVRDGVSTYRVVLQFSAEDPRVRSGMTASLAIITARHANALVVPSGAIFMRAGQQYVQVRRDDALVDVPVTIGQASIGNVEVTSGLAAGETVVLTPNTAK